MHPSLRVDRFARNLGEAHPGKRELLVRIGVDDAAARATVLFAAIDGAAQHYVLDPEGYPLDAVASSMIRSLVPSGDPRRS